MWEGVSGGDRRRLAGLVLVGFLLRITVVVAFQAWERPPDWDFAGELGAIAKSVAEGRGWSNPFDVESGPTAWQVPGFTSLMALVFTIFGVRTPASALVLQVIISAASAMAAVPLFLLARRLFGDVAAWAGAALWGVYPNSIWFVMTSVETAGILPVLVLTLLVQVDCLGDAKSRSSFLKVGALLGAFALLRTTLLSLTPGIVAILWFRSRLPLRERATRIGLLVAAAILLISPWVIRNWVVLGAPGMRSNLGVELRFANSEARWRGLHDPEAPRAWFELHPSGSKAERDRYIELGEVAYAREAFQDFRRHLAAHPDRFAELVAYRVFAFWFGHYPRPAVEYEGNLQTGLPLRQLKQLWAPAMTLLGFGGLLLARSRGLSIAVPGAALLLMPIPYYLTNVYGRYRMETEGVLIMMAGYLLGEVFLRMIPPSWSAPGEVLEIAQSTDSTRVG